MKSISLLACLAAASVICVAVGCSSKSDDNKGSAGTGGTSGGTAGSSTGAAGDGAGAITGDGGDGNTGGGGVGVTACSTGVLFEGNPTYEDAADYDADAKPKAAGQDLLADPPIRSEAMAIIGTTLFYETETEIWAVDTAAKTPQIKRIAGNEGGGFINAGVACAETQFLVVRDMVATKDGKLALVDAVGGAVLEITDPTGANCKSAYVAGTHAKTADPGDDFPLNSGDDDGPGASATFGGDHQSHGMVQHITVDSDGNYYTWEDGPGLFRKIANDKNRTVSTIGRTPDPGNDNVLGMAFLNGKLYATGVDGSNDFFLEIDPKAYKAASPSSSVKEVFRAPDHFQDVGAQGQAVPSTLVADGDAFILASQEDIVWRMGADGKILDTLAGSATYIDFTPDFDPTKSHPATDWELVNTGSNHFGGPWIAYADGKLYWTGGVGINKYSVQFSCP